VSAPRLLALGSINVDFEARVERWPEASETLIGHDLLIVGGGKAANVAVVARRLGVPAQSPAHLGDDVLAETALACLRELGVDLSHTRRVPRQTTGVSQIWLGPDGDKRIVLCPNANDAWTAGDGHAAAQAIARAPAGSVLVLDCEVPADVVHLAIAAARDAGHRVVLDPSPADRVPGRLDGIAWLTPNASEAEHLTGVAVRSAADAERAGRALLERGAATAAVKLHGGGCVVVTHDHAEDVPAPTVSVVDTTGAGDAFAGGLGVAVLEGRDPIAAARFAVAVSSFAVTRYGSQSAYPTRDELASLGTR